MVDFKEALAALDVWEISDSQELEALACLREFVQSVAQEMEDWVAIDSWNAAHPGTFEIRILNGGAPMVWLPQSVEWVHGATRAEALSKAATWCRTEMAK